MPRIPVIKVKDFCELLVKYGCVEVSIRGSHHKIHNPSTGMTSIVAVHSSQDLDRGSFTGILGQLGIDLGEFLKFIS